MMLKTMFTELAALHGRGAEGDAISFAGEDNAFNLPAIEKYIDASIPTADVTPDLVAELKALSFCR